MTSSWHNYSFEGIGALGVKKYTSKIGLGNQPSISMFTKIGFNEVGAFLSEFKFVLLCTKRVYVDKPKICILAFEEYLYINRIGFFDALITHYNIVLKR